MIKLNWDSDFFKHEVFRIDFKENSDFQLLKGLTYVFSENPVMGFSDSLQDIKITFTKDLSSDEFIDKETLKDIVKYDFDYVDENLLDLALQSGSYSRFKKDANIPNSKFEKLYDLWVRNSVNKKIADEIFVVFIDETISGFVTVKKNKHICKIGLIAVSQNFRGLGLGKKLMQRVDHWALENKCNLVEVETQLDNEIANKFYKSLGFLENKREYIYHIWK
ncbi:GNAT family N-acetyltransferase [Polaribacter sp. Q13]|uniref:GNAT family N-acetyltransferase n=1 Tax=Polaribacter sp. Q13 TaxID=2806551 RepID=UPI00193B9AA0|nr:GNAT family N-acetyltransferase [Polaribacter sp. Q13]QVY65781.1 GNAT family N-acetyltransferase [Polaribacter sp. Q13]